MTALGPDLVWSPRAIRAICWPGVPVLRTGGHQHRKPADRRGVTVADQLPGLTGTAIAGDGWTCTLASLEFAGRIRSVPAIRIRR